MSEELKLSVRQQDMLHFIHDSLEHDHRPPTIREIGGALDISSTSVVNYNLNRLKDKGLLLRDKTVSRGLRLTDAAYAFLGVATDSAANALSSAQEKIQNLINVPILGYIKAGEPIDISSDFEVNDEDDIVELSTTMLPRKREQVFALRVDGDSMIDDMISDGDIVILQKTDTARDGDVVSVWVEGEGNTLKRIYAEEDHGRVRLQPRNPSMSPIYVTPEDVIIQGKLLLTLSQPN